MNISQWDVGNGAACFRVFRFRPAREAAVVEQVV